MKTMLKTVFAVGSLILMGALQCQATITIAKWTFETSVPTTAGPHSAEGGVNSASSFASGFHSSATAAVYSNPSGNGSSESYSANRWSVNDYWQFSTSGLGYQGIQLEWDQGSSATGPRSFELQWSANGGPYATFGSSYLVLDVVTSSSNPNQWGSTAVSTTHYLVNLSSISTLNGAANISFRLVDNSPTAVNGSPVGTTGSSRVDNFMVSGTAVPEASTWVAGLGLSLGMLGTYLRKNRK